jgi:amidase
MNNIDLAFTSALELAQLIRNKEISPLEITQIYLDRIAKFNPQLGSFFYVASQSTLEDAQAKTETLAKIQDTNELPPFFGVPTAIKDLNPVLGMPCSYGVAAIKDKMAEYDEVIVTKMRGAGFIILGKTATSQVGSLPYTEPDGFAPSRNPWHLDHTTGGSSGGAAGALAGGLCAIAQGNDGGGSIRIPAACCGLIGIKPARGRVSYAPIGDYQNGIATNGTISRTVADGAALLDVISGYVTGDPYWLNDPAIAFREIIKQEVKPLRIAFSAHFPHLTQTAPEYEEMITKMAQNLEQLGHTVVEACPDVTPLVEPFKRIWEAGVPYTGFPLEVLSPLNQYLAQQAGSAGAYLQAVTQMQIISRSIVGFFESFDALLLPVLSHAPIKIGAWADLTPVETIERVVNWIAPCPLANATGLPAISLPTGKFDQNGLPMSLQFIGKPADEATLLQLATQLEQAQLCRVDRPTFSS